MVDYNTSAYRNGRIRAINTTPATPWEIHNLIIEIVKLQNENIVKFTSGDNSIYMKPSTVLFMLNLEHCVEHARNWIMENVYKVEEKFKQFVNIIRLKCIHNRYDALKKLREVYDETSIIECELIMYASDRIIFTALYLK